MDKKRVWHKDNRDKLAGQWYDKSWDKEKIINFWSKKFPDSTRKNLWEKLRKMASRMGCSWNKVGLADPNLPTTSLNNPFEIKCCRWNNPKIHLINSTLIGLDQSDDSKDYDCLFRNALRVAQADQDDAVIVTGNLVYIDTIRYSNLKPYRSRLTKLKPKKNLINYPKIVRDTLGDLNERIGRGDLIFIPFKERLDHIVDKLRPLLYDGRNKLIYQKPIYLCFGIIEEALAVWLTNENIDELLAKERTLVQMHISLLRSQLKQTDDADEKILIKNAIEEWEIYRHKFIKKTNVADDQIYRIYNQMRSYIIQRVENIAENVRYIGTGKTYIRIGKGKSQKVVLINIRPDKSTKDTFMNKIMESTRSSISLGNKKPDLIINGGTNLTFTELPISYMKKEKPTAVKVAQLPIAVDARSLREKVDKSVKIGDALFKLTANDEFYAGTVIYEWVDGLPRKRFCHSDFLTNSKIFSSLKKIKQAIRGKHTFYIQLEGDEHCGHKWVCFYDTNKFPYKKFHSRLVNKFLEKAPICIYLNAGDLLQGHNHEYELEKHPYFKLDYEIVDSIIKKKRELRETSLSGKKQADELIDFIQKSAVDNALFGGIIRSGDQLKSYIATRIVPNLNHFYRILLRAKMVHIDTRGTLGIINYLAGNHFMNTFEGEFSESELIIDKLIDELKIKYPDLDREELRRKIAAPMYSNIALSEGIVGINPEADKYPKAREILHQNKYYYYGFSGKHKLGDGSSKFADSIRRMRQSVHKRGTTSPWFLDRFTIFWSGHTHYGGNTMTQNSLFVRCGSQTFHDAFGEKANFPLNNISTEIIGLPKDGPHTAPITLVHLCYEDLAPYAKQKWPINMKKLFANSIVEGEIKVK